MKIAFDENTPAAMVRLFEGFQKEKALRDLAVGVEIERAQDYYPDQSDGDYVAKSDAPWIRRFAAAGGRVVISGDAKMRQKSHERLALVQAELVVIFFNSKWSEWRFCRKCSLLIHWWPAILATAKKAKPGFFSVPMVWPDEGKAKLQPMISDDLKLLKINRQKSESQTVRRARRKSRNITNATGDLFGDDQEA